MKYAPIHAITLAGGLLGRSQRSDRAQTSPSSAPDSGVARPYPVSLLTRIRLGIGRARRG
jgi:hypothetical protein